MAALLRSPLDVVVVGVKVVQKSDEGEDENKEDRGRSHMVVLVVLISIASFLYTKKMILYNTSRMCLVEVYGASISIS